MKSLLHSIVHSCIAAGLIVSASAGAQVVTLDPAQPTLLDVVRVRADNLQPGQCPVADTQQVSMEGNMIKVVVNNFNGACPAQPGGYFIPGLAIGRFPKGNYIVQLQLKMPSGAIQAIAEKAFSVSALPERHLTGAPVDDYTGVWMNSLFGGDALFLKQSGRNVVGALLIHGPSGEPVWYAIPPGAWVQHTKEEYEAYSYPAILLGDLYKSTGAPFAGGLTPSPDTSAVVGSVRITFIDLDNITLFVKLNGPNGVETVRALSPLKF